MAIRRQVSIPFIDKAESISTVSFFTTEAALDADNATGLGVISALQGALSAMSLASVTGRIASVNHGASWAIPTNDSAYNGNKLTVFLKDSVTFDTYQMQIPAVNPASYNTPTGSKNVLLTVAEGGTTQTEDLVTAIEAAVLSKDGNAVTVLKITKSSKKQGG